MVLLCRKRFLVEIACWWFIAKFYDTSITIDSQNTDHFLKNSLAGISWSLQAATRLLPCVPCQALTGVKGDTPTFCFKGNINIGETLNSKYMSLRGWYWKWKEKGKNARGRKTRENELFVGGLVNRVISRNLEIGGYIQMFWWGFTRKPEAKIYIRKHYKNKNSTLSRVVSSLIWFFFYPP